WACGTPKPVEPVTKHSLSGKIFCRGSHKYGTTPYQKDINDEQKIESDLICSK
ncbi:MAG: hypothetical protein ACI81W_003971, partial [Saprospiraceae bacterium]